MATGRLGGGIEEAPNHAGSSTLLDNYTGFVERGVTDPPAGRRGAGTSIVPDVLDQSVVGRRWRLWDSIYFGIIHVIPRTKDLGAVISQTTFQAEVWNADDVAHLGNGITIAGSSGVSVGGGPMLPAFWAPFSSYFFPIVVDGQGDPVIDTVLTWIFPGFTGTDLRILGFRLSIYPLPPQGDEEFSDVVGWLTSIEASDDETEQRRQLRAVATHELSYNALARSPAEAAETMARLFNGGYFLFGIPYWPDATPLLVSVLPGATTLVLDTAARAFTAGQLVLVHVDARHWEVFTIASVSVGSLTLTSPTVGSWQANRTNVIPVLPARLVAAAEPETLSRGVCVVRATFASEPS